MLRTIGITFKGMVGTVMTGPRQAAFQIIIF
jgi:hypothetical protein